MCIRDSVSVVPGGEPAEMITEARRSVEQLDAVSVTLESTAPGKMWHYADYDSLWETAVELDFPLSVHGSQSKGTEKKPSLGRVPVQLCANQNHGRSSDDEG